MRCAHGGRGQLQPSASRLVNPQHRALASPPESCLQRSRACAYARWGYGRLRSCSTAWACPLVLTSIFSPIQTVPRPIRVCVRARVCVGACYPREWSRLCDTIWVIFVGARDLFHNLRPKHHSFSGRHCLALQHAIQTPWETTSP